MFEFQNPGRLKDGELELILVETRAGDTDIELAPTYKFDMRLEGNGAKAGYIELRVGNTRHIVMYAGHIAYRVRPEHQGHRYAARACRLLLPLASRHDLGTLWITCNPENIASARTCELAGGELVETVDLPENTDMYRRGERRKRRYRFEL